MADEILCRCGAGFLPRPGKSNRYCSLACYRVAQRAGDYKRGHGPNFPRIPCAQCGTVVERLLSTCRDGRKSDKMFCSRVCYDTFRAGRSALRADNCQRCGAEFLQGSHKWRAYCGDACWKLEKKARPKNCVNCKCLFTPIKLMAKTGKFISHNSGKTCSAACQNLWSRNDPERKRKIGDAFRGDKHPNWQGGKALLNNVSNRGPNWAKQRAAALKRDGYQCGGCGLTEAACKAKFGRGLDVDHKVPFHNFGDYRKANSVGNLQSLCASCHRVIESKRTMVQMVLPMQDSPKRGHKGFARGERINTAYLTASDVMEIRKLARAGVKTLEIAAKKGTTYGNVRSIASGKTWKHLPL